MKNLIGAFVVLGILIFPGCDSDRGWDCIKTTGKIIEQEIIVPEFDKITVWDRVKLYVQQGEESRVVIKTGENLMQKIDVFVKNGRLEIHNNNRCNLFREYETTKVYITSPNITEIRSSTGRGVESIGELSFSSLSLISEDQQGDAKYHTSGDFRMSLNVNNLNIVANGRSRFFLNGKTNQAVFGLYAGDCRIYSEDLIIQDLSFFHRSTGPMVVNPKKSIKGKIVSLGNVISKNRPPIVEVEELYKGKLIFD